MVCYKHVVWLSQRQGCSATSSSTTTSWCLAIATRSAVRSSRIAALSYQYYLSNAFAATIVNAHWCRTAARMRTLLTSVPSKALSS